MNFDGCVFACVNAGWTDNLKPAAKLLGGKMLKAINKQTDFIICDENVMWLNPRLKSAIYQNRNNKAKLLSVQEFIEILQDNNIEVPKCLFRDDTMFDISTYEKKTKNFETIVRMNTRCIHQDVFQFNDDYYEPSGCGIFEFKPDTYVKNLLIKTGVPENAILALDGKSLDVYDVLKQFGYHNCFTQLAAILIAVKWFMDPDFYAEFRIYRDKWEERGDYYGMYEHEWQIPPAIYWAISNEHPYGYSYYE